MTDQTPDSNCSSEAAPVIEGFRILENLGHGATSSVWKAEQVSLNRLVVIKVLSERLTHEPEDVTLFKAEARMAANFKHAGIVQVYDFGQSKTGRRYYFVMEYISGYSVGDWIRRKGKITEPEALIVAQAVADALKYAWDLSRIVHCDIKPDNIMVDGDGSIKVADLGLAHTVKTMANQPGADAHEVIITGTPNYMAPEQVRGSDPIDCRTDIYALGASLHHMVTGQLPFGDSPPDIVLERQLHEAFAYPQQVNPDLSTSITQLILKMTAKEPFARFQTWGEVLEEVVRLERQMRHRDVLATQSPAPAPAAPTLDAQISGQRSAISNQQSAVSNISTLNVPPGDGRSFSYCTSCGKSIQPQAMYCGFCGKSVVVPAKEPVENQKHITIRLKPIQESSPASAKPAVIHLKPIRALAPGSDKPVAPASATQPRSTSGRRHASLGNHVCTALTLFLLAFLGYYAYQKARYGYDVLIPIKAAIIRAIQPMFEKSRLYTAPVEMSAPDETPAPTESSGFKPAAEVAQESESSLAPAVVPGPEATERAVSAMPEAPVPTETPPPPAVSGPPRPEPATASFKSPQDLEYERILQACKQQQPKAGDRITLLLKNRREPVEGVLKQMTSEGVQVTVPVGDIEYIEYPFHLMAEESRLMYFPEERARQLQRLQGNKSE